MQSRFAVVLLGLGLVDLVYLNLGPAPAVLARRGSGGPERLVTRSGERPDGARTRRAAEPTPASVTASLAPASAPAAVAPAAASTAHPSAPPEEEAARDAPDTPREPEPPRVHAASLPEAEAPASDAPTGALTVTFPDVAGVGLTPEARAQVLALAETLKQDPERRLYVTGHADARGSQAFNRQLGARRARAVIELLVSAGVPREQLDWDSRGEDEPRALGASEQVWASNRRVEINIDSARSETP